MHDWLALLRTTTSHFAELLADADLEAPVAPCPGWDVRALAQHLGWIHGWATHAVVAGDARGEPAQGPHERDALREWYAASAATLVEALEQAGPDGVAWTFGAPEGRAAFWRRRQVHETRVHLWDARTSQGLEDPLDPALSWDGVQEVAEVFWPRQVAKGRAEQLPVTLRLEPTDLDVPHLDLGEGPVRPLPAPAGELLLLLWGRAPAPADLAEVLTPGRLVP